MSMPPFNKATNSSIFIALNRWAFLYIFSFLILILALPATWGCTGKAFMTQAMGEKGLQTGHALLVGNEPEGQGYGLYSYLLLEAPPTQKNIRLFQSVLAACLREIPNVERLEKLGSPRETLNVTYIPITEEIPQAPSKRTTKENLRWWSQWVLDHYNYNRAQAILAKIKKNPRRGPYIISTLSPVFSTRTDTSPILVQDLSDLPNENTQIAYEWVLDFVDRVSNPLNESGGWNKLALVQFTSSFRNARALSLADHKIPSTQVELNRAIQISDTWDDVRIQKYRITGYFPKTAYLAF